MAKEDFTEFYDKCRKGTPVELDNFLQLNQIDDAHVGIGFSFCCSENLDNAKWLFENHKDSCLGYVKKSLFFMPRLLNEDRMDVLLWLKEVTPDNFNLQLDVLYNTMISRNDYSELFDKLVSLSPDKYKRNENVMDTPLKLQEQINLLNKRVDELTAKINSVTSQ